MTPDPVNLLVQTGCEVFPHLELEIELSECSLDGKTSWENIIRKAACAALSEGLSSKNASMELYIELIDNVQSKQLNTDYRGKKKPTNVLSFPGVSVEDLPAAMLASLNSGPPVILGDLMIADAVVATEAAEQNKTISDHLSHLVVHGVLHLLGYDHIEENAATEMEALERVILNSIDISDPYSTEH